MNTKRSIRRFLWRHFPSLHSLIYNNRFNKEEYQELMDLIIDKKKIITKKASPSSNACFKYYN